MQIKYNMKGFIQSIQSNDFFTIVAHSMQISSYFALLHLSAALVGNIHKFILYHHKNYKRRNKYTCMLLTENITFHINYGHHLPFSWGQIPIRSPVDQTAAIIRSGIDGLNIRVTEVETAVDKLCKISALVASTTVNIIHEDNFSYVIDVSD